MAAFEIKNLWVRNLWTAFLTALSALLASVGLTTTTTTTMTAAAAPASRTVGRRPVLPSQATRTQARREAVRVSVTAPGRRWSPAARDRSLPPTIKQRIRAEAHGSSPATRHLPAIGDESADRADSAARADGSPRAGGSAIPALVAA
ncbi:DUF6344 domain-containing protein [Streptomyces sp. NPDC052236]|uniref:DUF6344 domain-containing protein n=1 Tax=Streptomyces sp. NPDC052236 TaxID=3365686 RepID=UPI0037D244CB